MKLLVMGGTTFLGRAVVDAALEHGHGVTTFTRGRSGSPPAGVTALHGDRTRPADLDVLVGRSFDAVVDTSGYTPGPVGEGARRLAAGPEGGPASYVFVSSANAYRHWPDRPVPDENAPTWADGEGEGYGPEKAACERVLERTLPGRVLAVRAGLLAGPRDDIGRLPWWLWRLARGGPTLAPGDPDRPLALLDARDLAAFLVTAAERGWTGPLNSTGPPGQVTMGELLAACRDVTGGGAELVWAGDDALVEHRVEPWLEVPLWVPAAEAPGLWETGSERARGLGLASRPVAETVADTWQWLRRLPGVPVKEGRPVPGLAAEREKEILAALGR